MISNRDSGDECGCARCQADAVSGLQRTVNENLDDAIETGYAEYKTWPAADVAADMIAFCDDPFVQDALESEVVAACAYWLSR